MMSFVQWRFMRRVLAATSAVLVVSAVRSASAQGRPPRMLPDVAYKRLDSLEQAALSAPTFAARLDAVGAITYIGAGQGNCWVGPTPTVIKYPGLVSRLAVIYRRSQETALREGILWQLRFYPECTEAAAFLAEAAAEAPLEAPPASPGVVLSDDPRISLQSTALAVLRQLGPIGETTLRRLYAQGTVRDSSARAFLERLSRQGFPRP